MGHGKNKQKSQKVGLGQQPKETREERRRRIEEEAKAREVCTPKLGVIRRIGQLCAMLLMAYASVGGLTTMLFLMNDNSHLYHCCLLFFNLHTYHLAEI